MKLRYPLIALIAALLLVPFLAGCESRSVEVVRGDGSYLTYNRVTFWGESNTDGIDVAKEGEDFAASVGPTGSKTLADIVAEGYGVGLGIGKAQAEQAAE